VTAVSERMEGHDRSRRNSENFNPQPDIQDDSHV